MKKTVLWTFLLCFSMLNTSRAEDDFFDNLIVDEELKNQVETEINKEKAQATAAEILDQKPILLEIDGLSKIKKKDAAVEEIAPKPREPAPFGLKWLATKDEIIAQGVKLAPYSVKDAPNSYMATDLPKPVKAMREVLISFGDTDELWRISGYGKLIEDDEKATKGLEEYHKFYDILAEKYGNADEFYTPYVENVEENTTAPDGTISKTIKQHFMDIGDEGFKQKLMSGESTLYATFENDHISVTLALLADGEGKTYIIIDYTNNKVKQTELEKIYDAL